MKIINIENLPLYSIQEFTVGRITLKVIRVSENKNKVYDPKKGWISRRITADDTIDILKGKLKFLNRTGRKNIHFEE